MKNSDIDYFNGIKLLEDKQNEMEQADKVCQSKVSRRC